MALILAALSSEKVGDIPDGRGRRDWQESRELSKCTREVTHGQGPLVPNSVTALQLEGLKNWKAHSPQSNVTLL